MRRLAPLGAAAPSGAIHSYDTRITIGSGAMVFELTGRWAKVFGGIGADGSLYRYEGGTLWGGLQDFTATVGSVGTATPPGVGGSSRFDGSGGGFSGGGFSDGGEGGGGGGW